MLNFQKCKRFDALTRLLIIWTNAHKLDILSNDYPFPLDVIDLEQRTRHAKVMLVDSPVSEIKFISGRQHKWLLTASKGTRSVLMIWDIVEADVTVNDNPDSEASVMVSLSQIIVLLHLDDDGTFHEIYFININLRLLHYAHLQLEDRRAHTPRHAAHPLPPNHLTPPTDLVLHAQSIALYVLPSPTLVSKYSFGWVDGASATPTSIPIRNNITLWDNSMNPSSTTPYHPSRQCSPVKHPPSIDLLDVRTSSSASGPLPSPQSGGAEQLRDPRGCCLPQSA
ncbi:uncharacterized protein BT62DRAFT_1070928 [Guyanagaster necrorhizus]|uniref:Uncharacterized protein n=1 Tax=Guyanagaster necrorhizus TaxID=856835 RepID=A0A9P7VEC0_9AGAR|nr:uncharacterized protein BT62DRAFT_1081624 [Guyanagaster necrorhizus MCA 3950]XP_043045185.1 uncharacterized protein BT62DRAFT_1070928 [Guyanagaster necrorhizus MCA 3950]KAG7439351.1 hypothetical protein BT62DRAFT_1081624 [Guyanagaster necrorhizus MCA 3950]KAG7451685.1 hypothetical protein BT62DRAFT_1070928 [Guyanagaster necrorhizus MCA 3950]